MARTSVLKLPRHPKPPRPVKVDLSGRRGLPREAESGTWETLLIRGKDPKRQSDPDGVIDQLLRSKVISAVERNIGAELRSANLAAPEGRWALLLKAPGQSWLFLARSWRDTDLARELSARTGLTTLSAGHEDTASVTYLQVYDGKALRLQFSSTAFSSEQPPRRGPDTDLKGSAHPFDWLNNFESEIEAGQALLEELDAYAPYIGAYSDDGRAFLHASDRGVMFHPDSFVRIDLLLFDKPKPSKPAPKHAGSRLKKAIDELDADGVRAAIAAGADLTLLPDSPWPPLQRALRAHEPTLGSVMGQRDVRPGWLEVIEALLEGGADANGPEGANPPICALGAQNLVADKPFIKALGMLLDHGADASAWSTDQPPWGGLSVVHLVAATRGVAALKFLHGRGVNLFEKNEKRKTALELCELFQKRRRKALALKGDVRTGWDEAVDFLRAIKRDRTKTNKVARAGGTKKPGRALSRGRQSGR